MHVLGEPADECLVYLDLTIELRERAKTYAVPAAEEHDIVLEGQFPLSEAECEQFIGVLTAMKPALVGKRKPKTGAAENDPDE